MLPDHLEVIFMVEVEKLHMRTPLDRNSLFQAKLPSTQESTSKSSSVWCGELPQELQSLSHRKDHPLAVKGSVVPNKLLGGIGMIFCLMEDGNITNGVATIVS